MSRQRAARPVGDDARDRLLSGLPVTERRLQPAGVPTCVLEGGDGPPLVLLHGPGEFAAVWMRVIPELVKDHRVVVPDLPGHGASGEPDGSLDADRVLAWLDELLEQTCAGPPVLVGRLLGGAVAARFAIDYGDRVDRLVLVDSFGLGRLRPSARYLLALVPFIVRPTERSQDRLFRQCMVDLDVVRHETGERWEPMVTYALERARAASQKSAIRSLMSAFSSPIPPEALSRITVPTTLIWGRQDRQVRLRVAERASAQHGWPLHVIDAAADDPASERPTAFLEELRSAIRHDR